MRLGGEKNIDEILYTRREPLGVVSIITPWTSNRHSGPGKIAPALIYGNTSGLPNRGRRPADWVDAGRGVGRGRLRPASSITDGVRLGHRYQLAANPAVNGISFTRFANEVGAQIYQAGDPETCPAAVGDGRKKFPGGIARCQTGARGLTWQLKGGFGLTGQACTATSRVSLKRPGDTFVSP